MLALLVVVVPQGDVTVRFQPILVLGAEGVDDDPEEQNHQPKSPDGTEELRNLNKSHSVSLR
ncbi:hypothetical protein MTBLM5_30095 [Magnetospirillum sp. LM-5]|nr:hypothetical protein MTBLM5_30095 [Magnetospirillum sp. LM-5]